MKKSFKTMHISTIILFLLIPHHVFAECWVASGLKGYLGNAALKFNLYEDRSCCLSGNKIQINIKGNKSSVTGSEDLYFIEVTPQLIVGIYKSGGYKDVVESWGVDIENRKVFFTQAKTGYTIFDGVKMYVGDLEGKCN